LPLSGRLGQASARSFFAREVRAAAARGRTPPHSDPDGDEAADKGVWMSLFVDEVDDVHRQCVAAGLDVTFPPTDMPWNVREMHVRHPDGHVFRVGKGIA